MKEKVLLMGASGSGKTSMRTVIFSNNPASLTARLGATIDVEQNHVRFLGDLILNLWDCGGQDSFMDSYLTTQKATIFQHVGVMIYVFDVSSMQQEEDMIYYRGCLDALRKFSPEASVFLLLHKMDLVPLKDKAQMLDKRRKELLGDNGADTGNTLFATSIHDESLYKAWSRILHTLIPNASLLSKHLKKFSEVCNATEVILFERTTFLVIATSNDSQLSDTGFHDLSGEEANIELHRMNATRYERTSELIKQFKHNCLRMREGFHSLEMELQDFTAVLDELTKNTYIMVIVHDPTIETAAIKLNIRLARQKFEELQAVPGT